MRFKKKDAKCIMGFDWEQLNTDLRHDQLPLKPLT